MVATVVPRTCTNQFGTFSYEPTQFEQLVEELAQQMGVVLPELTPEQFDLPPSSISSLARVDYSVGNKDVHVSYKRTSSIFRDIKSLYSDKEPLEYAYIKRGDKQLKITFNPSGFDTTMKVEVYDKELAESLKRAKSQFTLYPGTRIGPDDAWLPINFAGSASASGSTPNYTLDMINAFILVREYLGIKPRGS